jgi:hypothetical protein
VSLTALTQSLVHGLSGADKTRRFLTIEDCTWRGDPEFAMDPSYDPTRDPRWGVIHRDQWDAVNAICANIGIKDAPRQFLLLTARQAAKTSTKRLAAIKTATERPGSKTLYVSFDLATGQELIYEPVQAKLMEMGWQFKATASGPTGLRIKLENGSIIQCRSADDLRSAGRLRGRGWHLILGDEVQDMLDVLRKLFDEVLGPTTFRYSGVTVLAFTPPDVQAGWLWDQYTKGRWQRLGWPMGNNPFLPAGAADAWMSNRGLTLEHPIAKREVLGLWISNVEKLVFEFDHERNTYSPGNVSPEEPAELPTDLPENMWSYGIGGDIGWVHPSSVTLLAWNRADVQKRIFEVLTQGGPGWTFDKWLDVLVKLRMHIKRKPFRSFIIDQAGSGGLNIVHSLEERFRQMGLPVELTYKPANVAASVGLTNDQFRLARLKLRTDSSLLEELPRTMWKDDSNRTEIDKAKFDPHGLDGLRYAVWGATNYLAKDRTPRKLTLDQERDRRELERDKAGANGEF